ncbi:MAG: DUF2283 domain-containing protein [Mesorhizobium sp.]
MIDMTCDPEVDAAYIRIAAGTVARTAEAGPFIYDMDEQGRVLGIEILFASKALAGGTWSDDKRSLTLAEIGERVKAVSDIYAARFQIERDELWHLGNLTEELGELNAAFLQLSGRGRTRGHAPEELRRNFESEAADLLAHLLLFAQQQKIDLEAALRNKWFSYLTEETG